MSFIDDMAVRLVTKGVGVIGTTIFESSDAAIPTGPGPFLTLSETGGVAPTKVQNKTTAATQRPTLQVLVRAGRIAGVQEAYPAARAMAKAAYDAFDGIYNTVINGTFYISVGPRQEPTDMGKDATGVRVQVVFNIEAEKQPS